MSDFKRKIEIVESTTPPSNKYNWWFDLNTKELKRWAGGKWSLYNFIPYNIPMPASNSITFIVSYDYSDQCEQDIRDYFGDHFGGLKKITNEYYIDDSIECHVLTAYFNDNITRLGAGGQGNLLDLTSTEFLRESLYAVKLPNSITTLGDDAIDSAMSSGSCVFVFGPEVTSIDSYAIHNASDAFYMFLGTQPPIIQSDSFDYDPGMSSPPTIYVDDTVEHKYLRATNWANMTIKSVSSCQYLDYIKAQ